MDNAATVATNGKTAEDENGDGDGVTLVHAWLIGQFCGEVTVHC